jgi:hypothetical protein
VSDVPVVWLSESRDDAARALREWARARGVVLSSPSEPRAPIAVDPAVADATEKELARAHEALAADDADAAARALGRAEALLRDHPEAPAAPFLRAEVSRAWSRLRLRQGDEAGAAAAWQDAEALDGGRIAGIGEKSVAPPPKVRLTIRGSYDVTVDGRPPTAEVLPGEHAVVEKRDGAVVYAAWIAVRGPMELTLPALEDACSVPAFARAKREGDRVYAPGASCPSWIAAVPSEHGVLVARCERDACAPLVEWRGAARDVFLLPPPDRSRAPLPAWATWTALGISAATIASVVLIAAGAFESRPVETRFVVGGSKQQ